MTIPLALPPLQSHQALHQVVLYNRALHPEIFPLRKRRAVRTDGRDSYAFEAWLTAGAHVLRFQRGALCASELLSEDEKRCPSRGVVDAFPCITDREFQHTFVRERVTYMNTVQNETLNDAIYDSTYEELLCHAHDTDALIHEWISDDGPCLSIVDIQRYHREIHAQCYHMIARGRLVFRTQTLFELN